MSSPIKVMAIAAFDRKNRKLKFKNLPATTASVLMDDMRAGIMVLAEMEFSQDVIRAGIERVHSIKGVEQGMAEALRAMLRVISIEP